jgi:nitroimidazol reductase NimA-like FMN-containing flavoprotein (pyridoxamine 5'-phosphate oxidase superfamily)
MQPFEIQPHNRVRKSDRAIYDRETVFAVLDAGFVTHAAFVANGRPMVIPMVYGRIGETLYLHGAKATRFVKALRGVAPVCLCVTHVDGLVLGRSAFHSSMNYRSVVIHGTAVETTDTQEREAAMAAITDHMAPGRWDEARPATTKELRATSILRVTIEAASCKQRSGPPVDDDEDYDLPVWAGVIPFRTVACEPEDDGRLLPGVGRPQSVARLVDAMEGR